MLLPRLAGCAVLAGAAHGQITLDAAPDLSALREAAFAGQPLTVDAFPLPGGESIELVLEPFRFVAPDAQILIVDAQGERALDLAPMHFLRGRAPGAPGSHVFLAITENGVSGRIELGPGELSYALTQHGDGLVATTTRAVGGVTVPCTTGSHDAAAQHDVGAPPVNGMRQAQLAIEGDYEFSTLFETEVEAVAYMLQVYAAASDIMVRDLSVRMDLTFLRLWATPDDPWGDSASWAIIPQGVEYDVSQLISGTRDVGAGGLAQVCAPKSWIGFSLGAFVDPTFSNVNNQDIIIAAHELGHNYGSLHMHDYGVDDCDLANSPTQRGSIVSYCYYFSGGYANTDMRYHVVAQDRIADCLADKPGFVFDCNQNGRDDSLDLSMGFSQDLNVNGIPDECEDCNGNGVLDPDDILFGFSTDVNDNGVPDECEPDCNANGVPDSWDIFTGASTDAYGNGIPDECETDCNANGVSDYTEIQLDMTLDIDRDAVLDACQDCDLDGVSDMATINGANSIWTVSGGDDVIREYHPVTGVLMRSGDEGVLNDARDVLITPDARILVSSAGDDRIVEFDRTGAYVGDLVATGAGGLDEPGAMLQVDDELLVASTGSGDVRRFAVADGTFFGVINGEELDQPYGLARTATGTLLVTSDDDRILEFDAGGDFLRVLVDDVDNGGLLAPRDLVVLDDGRLLVASMFTDEILAYDVVSGDFLDSFAYGSFNVGLEGVWGLAQAADGYVYATPSDRGEQFHLTDPRMLMYDTSNGFLIRTNVQRPDSQLNHPRGVAFMPGDGDCNRNLIPDSCDIASGVSEDANANGVPDECEDLCYADFNNDGLLNVLDFVAFQLAWSDGDLGADCNNDGALNVTDFVCFQVQYSAGCS